MKLEIKEKKENPLLSRREVTAYITFEGATPNLPDIKSEIAKQEKSETDLIDIVRADTHFGERKATVTANIYPDVESKKNVMGKVPKKQAEKIAKEEEAKKKAEEEKKKAEEEAKAAPKEEAAEEKPAEAPKEESEKPAEEPKPEAEAAAEEKKEGEQ